MDARIALITGTVFSGVLLAGAVAAPRIDGGPLGDSSAVTAAGDATKPLAATPEYGREDDDDRHGADHDGDDERDDDDDERDDDDDEEDDDDDEEDDD